MDFLNCLVIINSIKVIDLLIDYDLNNYIQGKSYTDIIEVSHKISSLAYFKDTDTVPKQDKITILNLDKIIIHSLDKIIILNLDKIIIHSLDKIIIPSLDKIIIPNLDKIVNFVRDHKLTILFSR